MVLDYHHVLCNNKGEKLEGYLERIFANWGGESIPLKIHFSSSKRKRKREFRSHSDYKAEVAFTKFLEMMKVDQKDFDGMLEAKAKDLALFRFM